MQVRQLVRIEKYDQALEMLTDLLTQFPDDEEVHFYFGYVLFHKGDRSAAEASLFKAISLKPDYAQPHSLLGDVHYENGRLKKAKESYTEALSLAPTEADYHANLAMVYHYEQNYKKALELVRSGLSHEPENDGCLLIKYRVFHSQGRDKEAEELLKDTLSRNPENLEALAQLGYQLNRKGQHGEARKTFKSMFAIGRDHEEAVRGLLRTNIDDNRLARILGSDRLQTFLAVCILLGTPFLFFAWVFDTNPPIRFYELPVLLIGQMCSFQLATFATVKFHLYITKPNTRIEFEKEETYYAGLSTLFFLGTLFLWLFIFGCWFNSIPVSRDFTYILFYSIVFQFTLGIRTHVYRPGKIYKVGVMILFLCLFTLGFLPEVMARSYVVFMTFIVFALDLCLYFGKILPQHTFTSKNVY